MAGLDCGGVWSVRGVEISSNCGTNHLHIRGIQCRAGRRLTVLYLAGREAAAARLMSSRRLKTGFFVLEGVNAFATAYYFNYLFFYLQKQFGFGNLGNLTFSACNGFVYIFSAWYGG